MAGPVHYEVFIRKTAPAPWSLLMATEDRKVAIETAEDMLRDDRAAAVRVTKETLDPDTMEFSSLTVLTKGAPEVKRKRVVDDAYAGPVCNGPADFYAPHARDLIGRVLEDWLARHGATPFELLHRPDLAEQLEASGMELQHAIQKVAIPESQAVGQAVHELIRHYQKLADAAVARVIASGSGDTFPDLSQKSVAQVAEKLAGSGDRAFRMGGSICAVLKGVRGARARLDRLMDLADQSPPSGPSHALVMVPVEQLAIEILAARTSLAEVLGPSLDQGGSLAAVVRMIAPREIEMLIAADARLGLMVPAVDGPAGRLARRMALGELPLLSAFLARMVLRELMSPRRLRPSDATGEIDILRTLATALTAAAGRLLSLEEVQDAFIERSKSLVTADFVDAYVRGCTTVLDEAEHLARLCENVMGVSNKRSAARWLAACVGSLRFEGEMRQGAGTPAQKLATLAGLQRSARAASLSETDTDQVLNAIGAVGGTIEADGRLVAQLVRANIPPVQKLSALLRMAAGTAAPVGPAADRAKAEAIKLFRSPQTRAVLASQPEALAPMRDLLRAAGMAA